jgi:hypothetical protein
MNRCFQAMLIFSTLCLSWLLMMAVHELGHVLSGWLSGARLPHVDLPIVGFSRTDFAANPHPVWVAWGGALWGSALPLAVFTVWRLATRRHVALPAWFAGFCLVANGAYLFGGALLAGGADDAGDILQHGGVRWPLLAFGAIALPAGLLLWNGLGPYFGLGPSRGRVDRRVAVAVAAALAAVVVAEWLIF